MEIHRLPEELTRKIAAGEVIERPLSVVKELIENSIDAGAKTIEVELIQGGKVLISVRDDGGGIAPDQMTLAVEKHATSKITIEADLEAISTLGYRGEALSSVSAVSHLEIYSRRPELPEGASLHCENGALKVTPVPLRPGTTVVVKDLFYNLPARRKFLKSAAAEFRRIFRLIQDYSFAYPHIAFTLIHGGKNAFKSSGGGSVEKLLTQTWGSEPEVRSAQYDAAVSSARVWWQDLGPQSRFQLISFVNGRRVSDSAIRSAVQNFAWAGRGNWLVMIKLPPEDVDVNVHPAKSEILFRHSGEAYDLVHKAAEKLSRGYSEAPLRSGTREFDGNDFAASFDVRPRNPVTSDWRAALPERESNPWSRVSQPNFRAASPAANAVRTERATERLPFDSYREKYASETHPAPEAEEPRDAARQYMGRLPQGYLIFSDENGLLIVDPHAAHERVNYERILKDCSDPSGQERLIMPIPLPPTLKDDAQSHKEALDELRFTIENGELVSLPMHSAVVGLSPVELLRSAVSAAEERREHSETLLHRFATKACKASVKLTARLQPAEALRLLDELEKCEQPNACPHGRPTALRLSGAALDKHFGRLGL